MLPLSGEYYKKKNKECSPEHSKTELAFCSLTPSEHICAFNALQK